MPTRLPCASTGQLARAHSRPVGDCLPRERRGQHQPGQPTTAASTPCSAPLALTAQRGSAMRIANKRLGKELMGACGGARRRLPRLLTMAIAALAEIQKSGPPTGTKLLRADDLREWLFEVQVLGESVYEGETFAMRFRFTDNYPLEAPEVVFVTSPPYRSPVVSRAGEGHLDSLFSTSSPPHSTHTSTPTGTAARASCRPSGAPCSTSAACSSPCRVCWPAARCVHAVGIVWRRVLLLQILTAAVHCLGWARKRSHQRTTSDTSNMRLSRQRTPAGTSTMSACACNPCPSNLPDPSHRPCSTV